MSLRNPSVAHLLATNDPNIKPLETYILSLEKLNLSLLTQNSHLAQKMQEVKAENEQLRAERVELERNLECSKEMVTSIEDLFRQMTLKGEPAGCHPDGSPLHHSFHGSS